MWGTHVPSRGNNTLKDPEVGNVKRPVGDRMNVTGLYVRGSGGIRAERHV